MSEFKEFVQESYQPILSFVSKKGNPQPTIPVQVMDPDTYGLLQIDDLYNAVNSTKTQIGALTLRRSLRQPLTSEAIIRAKQDSLRELKENPRLKGVLADFVDGAKETEKGLYDYYRNNYILGGILGSMVNREQLPEQYSVFKDACAFLSHLGSGAKDISVNSPYLGVLLETLGDFRQSPIFEWVERPVFRTFRELRPQSQIGPLTPELKFKPTDLKLLRYLTYGLPLLGLLTEEPLLRTAGTELAIFIIFSVDMGRVFDHLFFVQPLCKKFFNDYNVLNAVDSLGKIDELLSLDEYSNQVDCPTTLPKIVDSPRHRFSARGLRNPILVRQTPNFVPNDVELDGSRLTFLTGPNSGGKSTICRTVAQSQILAQIGGYVCAEEARMSVADRIFYQVPMIDSLEDSEGRLGVEVRRISGIFYQTTPKSLVILDELIEATTYEERLKHSYGIMDGFWSTGSNTVLVTHNHQLVAAFQQEGRGQFLQVEFDGKAPTYKVIPGISRESHSEVVLKRLGFTKEDIQNHLRKKGYIQ